MSLRLRIPSKIALLSVFMFLIQCHMDEQNRWRGSVERGGDATVIKNPSTPQFRRAVVEFKEDFTIKESDANASYLFHKPCGLLLDEKQCLYVLDSGDADIKVFDGCGQFIRTVGRQGNGPGELDVPTCMDMFQNEIAVYCAQNRRLTFFGLDGKYKRTLSSKSALANMQIDSEGNVFALAFVIRDGQGKYELQKFDPNLNYLKTLISCDRSPYWCCFIAGPTFAITNKDLIVYGHPEKYELKIFDNEGRLIQKIQKNHNPVRIPKEETESAAKTIPSAMSTINVVWPEYYEPFYKLYIDEEGRIIVNTHYRLVGNKEKTFDVFSSDGKFLTTINLNYFSTCLWTNGRLYALEEDDDGFPIVRVYRVIWKTQ
jgi:hypothetical protein